MADVNETLIKEAIRRAEEAQKAEEAKKAEEAAAGEEEAGPAEDAADGPKDAYETDNAAGAEAGNASKDGESAKDSAAESETEADAADGAAEAEAGTDAEETGDDTKGAMKKGGLFSKKSDKKDEKIAELNDKILRNLAEFENFRKRTDKEKSQMFEIGAKSIVEKILPTIDNFERGLATVPEDKKDDPFVQGMEKVYQQLLSSLSEAGVTPIEAVGKEFDPNLHNAVMHEDNEEFGENTVSAELQKGYMYRDTVVRHAMVKVAN